MKQPICVVDTNIIILMAIPPGPNEAESTRNLRDLTEVAVGKVIQEGAKLVVPTPVIAELGRDGPGSTVYKEFARAIRNRLRTAPLT